MKMTGTSTVGPMNGFDLGYPIWFAGCTRADYAPWRTIFDFRLAAIQREREREPEEKVSRTLQIRKDRSRWPSPNEPAG